MNTKPITFSERAIEAARKIMAEQDLGKEYGLRVAAGGGGCSGGVEPILGFDKRKEADLVYEISGLMILVDKKHMMHLFGKQVEYYEVEDVSGFHFVDAPL